MSKVRLLYDFAAESSGELTCNAGDEMTVVNNTAYEGWILVRNPYGSEGMVPSSYVEYLNDDDQDIPPPPSHIPYSNNQSWNTMVNTTPSWGNSSSTFNPTSGSNNSYTNSSFDHQYQNQPYNSANQSQKSKRDSFSDDSDEEDSHTPSTMHNMGASNMPGHRGSTVINSAPMSGTISRHKTKNSYGLDVFLLLGAVKHVLDSERLSTIVLSDQGQSVWARKSPAYQINIVGNAIDKKYHGVKKFTSYEIQAKIFNHKVKRRYNHFDWLHKRLVEKYPNICIPPLPDKAVTGNFEDEFISKRKTQLELWLNRMSAHPVVGQSEVFVHFLQCEDGSSAWKQGKRKAEKDEYRGSQWFCTLTVPGVSIDTPTNIRDRVDKFSRASSNLDNSVKNVVGALEKLSSYHSSSYKKELLFLGKQLESFGTSISVDPLDAPNNSLLSNALVTAGNTYTQIANSYGEQSKNDISPLIDRLNLYRGIVQQMPDIVQFQKNAIQTFEEFQQKPEKLEGHNLSEIAPRLEIINHVTFAEINLFNKDKVDDLTVYMRNFLQSQISFYTEITECLKKAYAKFEQVPVSSTSSSSPSSYSLKR